MFGTLISDIGIPLMDLHELKSKMPADLLAFAEELGIENASNMRKQDMMFSILKHLRKTT